MKKISLFLMLAAALAFGVIAPAQSTPTPISTTIGLSTVYTGNTPDNGTITGPWLTAIFTSTTGSTTGTLKLVSDLSSTDILQGLNSSHGTIGWAFYLNQSLASLTCTSGTCADNGALFGGSYNTGPVHGGTFNLAFGWSSGNRFAAGDSAVYDLTFANALTGNPFGPNGSDWWSVAHVQQISGACGDSGWIVYGTGSGASNAGPCGGGTPPPHNVPEPAALGMFGFGVLLIGLFIGLRRREV